MSVSESTLSYNLSDNKTLHQDPEGPSWVFELCIVLLGTVGNVLLCLSIIKDKSLQITTNYFLFSLAVADLLVSLIVIPIRVLLFEIDLEPSQFSLCLMELLIDNCLTIASAVHICFISLERYHAIRDPLGRRSMTKGRVLKLVMLVWILSFVFIIPSIIFPLLGNYPQQPTSCIKLLSHIPYRSVLVCIEAIVIYVMVAVVVYSFVRISLILRTHQQEHLQNIEMRRTVAGGNKDDKKKLRTLESEKKALRVIWIMGFAFVIALFPYGTAAFVYIFWGPLSNVLTKLVGYVNYTNSVINPVIYTVFNKQFRKNFVNLLMCRCKSN